MLRAAEEPLGWEGKQCGHRVAPSGCSEGPQRVQSPHLLPFKAASAIEELPEGGTNLQEQDSRFASEAQVGSNSSGLKLILYYPEGVVVGRKYQRVFAKRREHVAEIRLHPQLCLGCLFLFYIFRNLLGKETTL